MFFFSFEYRELAFVKFKHLPITKKYCNLIWIVMVWTKHFEDDTIPPDGGHSTIPYTLFNDYIITRLHQATTLLHDRPLKLPMVSHALRTR